MKLTRQRLLFFHGNFLCLLGFLTLTVALVGRIGSIGPFASFSENELSAVGFIEAYGLAAFLGIALVLASREPVRRAWSIFAGSIHFFLMLVNLNFWHLYAPLGLSVAGILATTLHVAFFTVEWTWHE